MISKDDFMKAMGLPDQGFDLAVDAALRSVREKEDRPVMKRKLTLTILAAILAVLVLTGAALAVSLNLFDYFGSSDPRLKAVAPDSTVSTESLGDIQTDALGVTQVRVGNAYYDGDSLIVAYTVENFQKRDAFVPTAAELETMTASGDPFPMIDLTQDEQPEQPSGTVAYEVIPADGWYSDDGTLLPVSSETIEQNDDGMMICLREFETPLPESVQNRDSLILHVPMKLFTSWQYFDGEKYYEKHAQETAAEISFAVSRTDAVTRDFSGTGELNGALVMVEAQVSAVHVKLRIDGAALQPLPEDGTWYGYVLRDSRDTEYRFSYCMTDESGIDLEFDGLGYLPDELALTVRVYGEGEWDADAHVLPGCPLTLKPE